MSLESTKETSNRVIISILGKDQIGIIAWLTGRLAEKSINILDLSQTILQGFFTMIMIVDVTRAIESLGDLTKQLQSEGEARGLKVNVQHEDIFEFMHRV
ncbi:ACT domain-containing protein [Desulfitobacterium sp. THU1]|uniref:ACT domain-containing protein n=1 Tax=Desulfitobacterium sp. THU1 TaxID=3138072 RepID=UPI00311E5595